MNEPRVSVIVTAHDAAGTIGSTAHALLASRDVSGGMELLFVDDRSTDGTGDVAALIAGVRVHRIDRYDGGPLTARQRALDAAIRRARGEVVVLADADATPDASWVRRITEPLEHGDADVVAGSVAFVAPRGGSSALASLQTVDAAYYLLACEALSRLRLALGMFFGAAAFRLEAYARLGGFASIGPALTEDLAFARAAHEAGLRIAFVPRPAVPVIASARWCDIIVRARRTSAGGASVLATMLGAWSLSLVAIVLLVAAGALPISWLVARWFVGAMVAAIATTRIGRTRDAWAAAVYEPFAIATGVRVLWALRRAEPVEWGGVEYRRAAPGARVHVG